jgi:putative transcriptional regulator
MLEMTHPADSHLFAYAAGSISSGLGLLVATHLALCPSCRERNARLELVGGAFLRDDSPPDAVRSPSLSATLQRLDEAPRLGDARRPESDPILPRPLRAALGRPSDRIRWRFLLPGLAHCALEGDAGEDVRLIRAKPGARLLHHTHEGCEATLVLAGQLRDGPRTFGRGAVSVCGPDHDHRPEIVGDEECICLIVLTGPMRFTGSVGRVLNLLTH